MVSEPPPPPPPLNICSKQGKKSITASLAQQDVPMSGLDVKLNNDTIQVEQHKADYMESRTTIADLEEKLSTIQVSSQPCYPSNK